MRMAEKELPHSITAARIDVMGINCLISVVCFICCAPKCNQLEGVQMLKKGVVLFAESCPDQVQLFLEFPG